MAELDDLLDSVLEEFGDDEEPTESPLQRGPPETPETLNQQQEQLADLIARVARSDIARAMEGANELDPALADLPDMDIQALEQILNSFAGVLANNNETLVHSAPSNFDESVEVAMKMISKGAQEIKVCCLENWSDVTG
jgi:hypothetical protein